MLNSFSFNSNSNSGIGAEFNGSIPIPKGIDPSPGDDKTMLDIIWWFVLPHAICYLHILIGNCVIVIVIVAQSNLTHTLTLGAHTRAMCMVQLCTQLQAINSSFDGVQATSNKVKGKCLSSVTSDLLPRQGLHDNIYENRC